MSFGTTTPSFLMPEKYKNTLINTFQRFPDFLFIWKYEKDDEFTQKNKKGNVVFKKFLPQVDLLGEMHKFRKIWYDFVAKVSFYLLLECPEKIK